jgi:hypothetical protein
MGSKTETKEKSNVVLFPMVTRVFKNGKNAVTVIYNPQSKRIVADSLDTGHTIGRHINSVTLELMQRGWITVSDGER